MKNKIMTHIVAGYPSPARCEKLALLMAKAGVAYIEIQIPFSDPVADGPTIMQANEESLQNGIRVADCFKFMKSLSLQIDTPLLFMSYFNILHHYGVEAFCKKARECGCWGLIVPDIPFDEESYEHYLRACSANGLKAIQVISPLTPESRLEQIGKVAQGFVYCVSRYGTTGAGDDLNPDLRDYLKKVRKHIALPIAVGFGISSRAHVEAVCKHADIAVIGSKVIDIIKKKGLHDVEKFLESVGG